MSNQIAQNKVYNTGFSMRESFSTHELIHLQKMQMDPEASPIDHVALALDAWT